MVSVGTDMLYPIRGEDSIMSEKAHGTTAKPVMDNLLYGVDKETADKICCYSRTEGKDGEEKGYAFKEPRTFVDVVKAKADAGADVVDPSERELYSHL